MAGLNYLLQSEGLLNFGLSAILPKALLAVEKTVQQARNFVNSHQKELPGTNEDQTKMIVGAKQDNQTSTNK